MYVFCRVTTLRCDPTACCIQTKSACLKLFTYKSYRIAIVWLMLGCTPFHPTYRLPTTNNQPPTTNNQPPTTNHQQPITNNQSPTTNNQPPTTNHQQLTKKYCHLSLDILHQIYDNNIDNSLVKLYNISPFWR
jgi:hypothetical protein